MGIENLGYVRLQVTDPKAWADFAVDVLGFGIAEHDVEMARNICEWMTRLSVILSNKAAKINFWQVACNFPLPRHMPHWSRNFRARAFKSRQAQKEETIRRAVTAFHLL